MDFANQLKSFTTLLIPEYCHNEFLVNFNFMHVACLKIAISKCLGLGLIAGSALVKIPQIITLMQAQSAVGLSMASVLLDLLAVTANVAYSYTNKFPFSAWGDGLFLMIQGLIITFLIFLYSGRRTIGFGFVFFYLISVYALTFGMTPMIVLWYMQAAVIPVSLSSKLLQVYENIRNGHTGQLSSLTCILLFAGSSARIFTSIQETGDLMLIVMYMANTVANFIIVMQIVYYWQVTKDVLANNARNKMR